MIQPNHNGAYEYLWFEHKYSVLAVSYRAYQNTGGKLGRNPQIIPFLNSLAHYNKIAEKEAYTSILNTYKHIKPMLSRKEKFEIISSLFTDVDNAKELIYSQVINKNEKSLPGCRVFYKRGAALYKYWDKDDYPGLWLCFGAFQLHLTPGFVIFRAAVQNDMDINEALKYLHLLRDNVDITTFNKWPAGLKRYLIQNNMVVLPGKTARLHPRIPLENYSYGKIEVSNSIIAALIQEKVWDACINNDLEFPNLVDYETFEAEFSYDKFPYLNWNDNLEVRESYDFLVNIYYEQKQIENNSR